MNLEELGWNSFFALRFESYQEAGFGRRLLLWNIKTVILWSDSLIPWSGS